MTNRQHKFLALPLIGALTVLGGSIAGMVGLASAQTTDNNPSTSSQAGQAGQATSAQTQQIQQGQAPQEQVSYGQVPQNLDPHKGGHTGANGTKEELLTGETATKATAAALAAVPGGTIERVETDAEGALYEAHMTKVDGSHVTVKMDANFTVTSTEDGFGGPRSVKAPTQQ